MRERTGKGRKRKAGAEAKDPPGSAAPASLSAGKDAPASGRWKALPAHCAKVALVLQGGGALGAYQAGVYEALAEHGYDPYRVTGISIGAINGAIIAGNPPEHRVERLREFWELITEGISARPLIDGDLARGIFNEWSALASITSGVEGFYAPRIPPAWMQPWGTGGALSFYDTAPLRATLERLVDFELLNSKQVRFTIGAANIRKGNSVYFASEERRIGPEHIMASAALPPGFPPVDIDGEHYWDGGVLSNTPLEHLLDEHGNESMLVFQVDLFSANGTMPRNLLDVYERHKDILYSSRTRKNTNAARQVQELRKAVDRMYGKLPSKLKEDPDVVFLKNACKDAATISIVHLIYRDKYYETQAKDYEFSRVSMLDHWQAGLNDTRRTLRREDKWLEPPDAYQAVRTFDITRDFD
jgi:NTE family protein